MEVDGPVDVARIFRPLVIPSAHRNAFRPPHRCTPTAPPPDRPRVGWTVQTGESTLARRAIGREATADAIVVAGGGRTLGAGRLMVDGSRGGVLVLGGRVILSVGRPFHDVRQIASHSSSTAARSRAANLSVRATDLSSATGRPTDRSRGRTDGRTEGRKEGREDERTGSSTRTNGIERTNARLVTRTGDGRAAERKRERERFVRACVSVGRGDRGGCPRQTSLDNPMDVIA